MYTEVKSYGNSYNRLKALIEMLAPNGTSLPTEAPYPGRGSFFVLKGASPELDKLYLSDGAGGWTLAGGSSSDSGAIESILPGANISIDTTDPANPIISAVLNQSGKYLISGGAVWSGSGLTYDVSAVSYYWNGNKTGAATQVILDDSDETNSRLDALVISEAGTISVITGDPSASPITPAIPEDQLLIQFILVTAASTEPTVTQEDIYLENAEWTGSNYTTAGTQVGTSNFEATDTPKQGTKCIDNSLDGRTGIHFDKGTTLDVSDFTTLSLWVRLTAAAANKMKLNVRFENASLAAIGNELDLFNYGLQRSVVDDWQLCIVPLAAFGVTTVQGFRMIYTGGQNGTENEWDVDFITLTDGSTPSVASPNISFYKDGTKIADESGVDIIAGTGMTITAVEDAANKKVKYTFNSTATGGATIDDTTPAEDKVYSSQKTTDLLDAKLDSADYNQHYKGKFTSLAALQAALPTGTPGDYAQVDTGAGNDVKNYNWDDEEGWVIGGTVAATTTDALPEGSTNLYFTVARVLASVLTGLSVATGGDIISTDTVLSAFGKIQKRFNDLLTTFNVANKLVQLDATGKLPALDGSQLTNLPSSGSGGGGAIFYGSTGTSTNHYTTTIAGFTTFVAGQIFAISFLNAATGSPLQLSVNGLPEVTIKRNGTTNVGPEFSGNSNFVLIFDGTYFQLTGLQITNLPILNSYNTFSSQNTFTYAIFAQGILGTAPSIPTANLYIGSGRNNTLLPAGLQISSNPLYVKAMIGSGDGNSPTVASGADYAALYIVPSMALAGNKNLAAGLMVRKPSYTSGIIQEFQTAYFDDAPTGGIENWSINAGKSKFRGGAIIGPMTTTEISALPVTADDEGLEVYNLTLHKKQFYNGTAWETITSS